jgi:hypothetical protein
MTGLWKAWKAKCRLSTLPNEPLGNLAKSGRDFHIPTAPATRLMGKWKTKNRFPTFPQPQIYSCAERKQKEAAAAFALCRMKLEM